MDTVRFHDSLPTSEMIAWVSARKGQMSNSLCFQIQKELAQDGAVRTPKAFFPTLALLSIFVLLLQNNACQLTSFSCQGFTSPSAVCSSTTGGDCVHISLVGFSDSR